MKKQRKSRNLNLELYKILEESPGGYRDTRYWGVFNGEKKELIKIDIKRYQKKLGQFSIEQLQVINARKSHYFYPKKVAYGNYNCNIFIEEISDIQKYWETQFKPIIAESIKRIKKPRELCPGDYYNLQCGISGTGAAQAWANWINWKNNREYRADCATLTWSLYSEFFHFMSARIEAITVKVLTQNNAIKDRFDRNAFYATAVGKNKRIEDLDHFSWYDKLYCLWNFIKHNSLSTYQTLKDRYPELLYEDEYVQGEMALYFIKFEDKMIEDIIAGCKEFFKEYCELVFNENYNEAQWNYCEYFIHSEKAVYYVNGEKQKGLYYSDGGNSMISRIFDMANVRLATEKYEVLNVHKVSDEEMVALNPHAMLIGGAYQNFLMDQLDNSAVWSALECNQQGRVYRIPVAMVGIENVSAETPVMLKYVASLFNPTYEFDMKTELKANIKKYFGYDLTDGDVENMCNALTKNGEVMVNAE